MYSASVRGGNVSTRATLECSTLSSTLRGRRGRVRNASVTGAPSAQNSGTAIPRIMCCTMCTLSSVVSYAAMPELVAKKNSPIPPTTNERVRPIGHRSPRS